jgi:outer membrane immunogenic protein
MKLAISLAVGVALISSAAIAGDMPSTPVSADAWSGFYAGVHAGYNWSGTTWTDIDGVNGPFGGNHDIEDEGGLVGVQVGDNWQFGSFVFGVLGDITYRDAGETTNDPSVNSDGLEGYSVEWSGTVRGKVGFAFDSVLLFATGGVAIAEVEYTAFDAGDYDLAFSDTQIGWTAGAGVAYAFSENRSVSLEYLHTEFEGQDYSDAGADFSFDDVSIHEVRASVNYRF